MNGQKYHLTVTLETIVS